MDNQTFMIEVENSHNRSKKVLLKKEKEYNMESTNRLNQFYRAGSIQNINPCEALVGMATKHFTSIVDMCKNPSDHLIEEWDEKLTDLRNYTYLLDALVRDMRYIDYTKY